ncbi:MAG: APC family permease [Fusobacteria bacterium]|nr:APC family permease [Fusobacteriota bacterium]
MRWFSTAATYGASAIVLWLLAAFLFFVPLSLICAEFGAKYPDAQGGITDWIKGVMGEKTAFFASWFYLISNIFYYPALLTFAGIAFSFSFNPNLGGNKLYIAIFVIVLFWLGTFIAIQGVKATAWLAKIGGLFGNILPIVIILILAGISVFVLKRPIPTNFSMPAWIPHFNTQNLIFLSTLSFAMSGVEISSAFVKDMENPKKNYPKAIFISAFIIAGAYILGTVALNLVISPAKIGADNGILQLIYIVTQSMHASWIGTLVCYLIFFSCFTGVVVWIVGAIRMFTEGNDVKFIPKFLKEENKNGVPGKALIVQAIIITIIMIITTIMPSVQSIYMALVLMSTMFMFTTYFILLIAFIKMKVQSKQTFSDDIFEIPGKKTGALIATCVALVSVIVTIVIPIISPTGNTIAYESQIIGGPVLIAIIGWLICHFKARKHM